MPITVNCTCGKQYPVKEEFAGQRVKCPDCGQVLTIPGIQGASANGASDDITAEPAVAELDDLPAADDGADDMPIVEPVKKKGGRGLLYAFLGCGCVTVLLGGGVLAAVLVVVLVGGVGLGSFALWSLGDDDATTSVTDKDKDKSRPADDKPKDDKPRDDKPKDDKPKDDKPKERPKPVEEKGPWKGHQAVINAVGFTADGRQAFSAVGGLEDVGGQKYELAPDNSIRFWNVADGAAGRRVDLPGGLTVAAVAPDGVHAAVVYPRKNNDAWERGSENVIHVWDLVGRRELQPPLTGHTKDVTCLAFKKNGAELLSGSKDKSVRLWNVGTRTQKQLLLNHTGDVSAVAFANRGNVAASGGADGVARLWDLDEGKQLREFKGHQDTVLAVALFDDGQRKVLLTACGKNDPDIRLWNADDGSEIKRFKGHTAAVNCLAFSADGRRFLSAGDDNTVRLWSVASGKQLAKFDGHTAGVHAVAFFPDGKRALSGADDRTLRVWDLPADLTDVVKNLQSNDPKVKQQAVRELAGFGDEAKQAVPALVKALAGGDAAFKQEVIRLLKTLGGAPGPEDAPVLAQLAADKSFPDGRLYALDALAALGPNAKPALPALLAILKEPDAVLRRKAITVIGQVGPDARAMAYAPLVEFLRDPDVETSKAAAEALPKLGRPTKDQVEALGRYLTDRNDNVRRYALAAVTELGAEAEPVAEDIAHMAAHDKIAELRKGALTTLVKIKPKDKKTVEAATAALKDDDEGVQQQAVAVLAQIGPSGGALPGLLQGLTHKNDAVRKAAEEAFDKATFDKAHVKALATALALNKTPRVRARLVDALGKLGPDAADAADDIGRVARDSDGELRRKAVMTLATMGPAGKKAAPMLLDVMTDPNEKEAAARVEAAIALTKMDVPESKQALPHLVKGILITDPADEKQRERQDRICKVLIALGTPAA